MRSPSLASVGVSSLGVATTKSALTNDFFKEAHLVCEICVRSGASNEGEESDAELAEWTLIPNTLNIGLVVPL